MISLWRGPGGASRRLGAEVVPLLCAVAAGGLYLPLGWTLPTWFGVLGGVVTGALTWFGASFVLRAVRRRPVLRRVYRVAVLAHVLFWSTLGVLASDHEPPGALEAAGASGWRAPVAFHAGAARTYADLPAHATLAGWGSRPRRLTFPPFGGFGVLGRAGQRVMAAPHEDGGATIPLFRRPDPAVPAERLGARAVVLRPDDAAAGPPVAFVSVDLVTSDRHLQAAVAEAVADLGIRPEGLLLAATHTHSGPGGYSRSPLSAVLGTDHFDARVFEALRDACADAVRAAHEAARPARIALVRARDRDADGARVLSRNRRRADAEQIDDRVYALRIDGREDGASIAVLLNYAVHPVLLRRRHLGFHRDLAGALEDAVRRVVPGEPVVLFVNGAQGDVAAERVDGLAGGERARALARRFAETVIAPAWTSFPSAGGTRLRLAAARTRRRMATPRLVKGWGGRAAVLGALYGPVWEGGLGDVAAELLMLPANAFVWSLAVPEIRFGFSWDGAFGFSLDLEEGVGTAPYDVGAFVFETEDEQGAGARRWALLWQPGEATQAVGKRWRAAVAELGIADTLVAGLAGGATAYVTTEDEFHREGYEAVATLFGPTAAADIGEAMLDALVRAGAAR